VGDGLETSATPEGWRTSPVGYGLGRADGTGFRRKNEISPSNAEYAMQGATGWGRWMAGENDGVGPGSGGRKTEVSRARPGNSASKTIKVNNF
jgi:hypothetical protein